MARARNIKPGFFTNDGLVELPFEVRLLFIGLWTLADREGRLEDRAKRIRMEIFPGDDVNVDQALDMLAKAGFIVRYEVDDRRYIEVLNFLKHQNPHPREAASTIPPRQGRTNPPLRTDDATTTAEVQGDAMAEPRQDQGKTKALPSRAESLFSESPSLNPDSPSPTPQPNGSEMRANPSTAVLFAIEARKRGIACNGHDPRLASIADRGVGVEAFCAACDEARKGRESERITLALPLRILEAWTEQASRITANGATAPPTRAPTAAERAAANVASLTGKTRTQPPVTIDAEPAAPTARLG